jgi:general secretion pathway protein L
MARRVIGLDVGTYSIKVTHLECRKRGADFEVMAYAEKFLSDFRVAEEEGDLPMLVRQQEAALLLLKAEGFFEEGTIISGLSGADAQVRSLSVPFTNTKKIQAVLGGILDAQLPLDIDDLVLSWFLQKRPPFQQKVNTDTGAQNQILVAFAKKNSVAAFLKLLQDAKVNPRQVTHKAAGLFDLLQHLVRKNSPGSSKNFAVLDLGFQTSSLCVGNLDRLLLARTVLRGGHDVTQNLATKLHLSYAEAEIRKLKTGFIETETEKAKLLEQHLMSEALKESCLPVIRELRQTVLALQSQGEEECTQIFLIGGGSKIKNLDQYFYEMLKIKTHAENDLKILMSPNIKKDCPNEHAP